MTTARRQRVGRGLDVYVSKICLGSFVVCLCFIVGLFVLIDLFQNLDSYIENLEKMKPERSRYGALLVLRYYLCWLPFVFVTVAPFVTVTAGMFAVSRLMGSNEIAPMLFTGRSIYRVLLPVFLMGAGTAVAMAGTREFVLPRIFTQKDNLEHLLKRGTEDLSIRDPVLPLPGGHTLFVDEFFVKSGAIVSFRLHYPEGDGAGATELISAKRAVFREDGAHGRGWYLTGGKRSVSEGSNIEEVDFIGADEIAGFDPVSLRKRFKQQTELEDLAFSDLIELVQEQPFVHSFTVALHHAMTFPIANIILLMLALPFALRFERGSKTERVFFALLVCAAYLVVDLIFRNLGTRGLMNPLVAAWFPTVLFGSLGIVIFDTVRT